MYGNTLGDAVSFLMKAFFTLLILLCLLIGLFIFKTCSKTEIRSDVKIDPEIELTTDVKTIDI